MNLNPTRLRMSQMQSQKFLRPEEALLNHCYGFQTQGNLNLNHSYGFQNSCDLQSHSQFQNPCYAFPGNLPLRGVNLPLRTRSMTSCGSQDTITRMMGGCGFDGGTPTPTGQSTQSIESVIGNAMSQELSQGNHNVSESQQSIVAGSQFAVNSQSNLRRLSQRLRDIHAGPISLLPNGRTRRNDNPQAAAARRRRAEEHSQCTQELQMMERDCPLSDERKKLADSSRKFGVNNLNRCSHSKMNHMF
jgi:hypothetical protein